MVQRWDPGFVSMLAHHRDEALSARPLSGAGSGLPQPLNHLSMLGSKPQAQCW